MRQMPRRLCEAAAASTTQRDVVPSSAFSGTLSNERAQAFARSLLTATKDFDVAHQPTGTAACDRVVSNTAMRANPYQPSCIEIRLPQAKVPLSSRKMKLDFTRMRHERDVAHRSTQPADDDGASTYRSMEDAGSEFADAEVFIYYETSTDQGLQGFQYIAAQVKTGLLPGRCENATAVGGFATWIVSRQEYIALVTGKAQIGDGGSMPRQR